MNFRGEDVCAHDQVRGENGKRPLVDRVGDAAVGGFRRIVTDANAKAQPLEAIDHRLRVLAPQRAAQGHRRARQGGQDQRAIGQALGARQDDGRLPLARWRDDLDEVRQHECQ